MEQKWRYLSTVHILVVYRDLIKTHYLQEYNIDSILTASWQRTRMSSASGIRFRQLCDLLCRFPPQQARVYFVLISTSYEASGSSCWCLRWSAAEGAPVSPATSALTPRHLSTATRTTHRATKAIYEPNGRNTIIYLWLDFLYIYSIN